MSQIKIEQQTALDIEDELLRLAFETTAHAKKWQKPSDMELNLPVATEAPKK